MELKNGWVLYHPHGGDTVHGIKSKPDSHTTVDDSPQGLKTPISRKNYPVIVPLRSVLRPVAGQGLTIIPKLARGPEQTAGDEVQVGGFQHGLIMVAYGGPENPALLFPVLIDPDTDMILVRAGSPLRQWSSGIPHLFNPVELPLGRGPLRWEPLHHGMIGLEVLHLDRRMPTMIARGHPEEPAPFLSALGGCAVAVHAAMQNHRRSGLVGLGQGLHEGIVLHSTKTLIMHDHVVACRPVLFGVDAHLMIPGGSPFVHDSPVYLRTLADTPRDNHFLTVVIVAASARHQKSLQRRGFFLLRVRNSPRNIGCANGHAQENYQRKWKQGRKGAVADQQILQKRELSLHVRMSA